MTRFLRVREPDRVALQPGIAALEALAVYPLGRDYPEYEDCFLVAITENRSVDEIGWLAHMLEHAQAGWGEHIHDHDEAGEPVANDHDGAVTGAVK